MRMKNQVKKPYLKLLGKPTLAYTLKPFETLPSIEEVVLVVAEEDIKKCQEEIVEANELQKVKKIVAGGRSRQESVFNGLASISAESKVVIIHDGVRPFVDHNLISSCLESAFEFGASTLAVPIKETIKEVDAKGMVVKTLDRSRLWISQTPQAFKRELILKAHQWAKDVNFLATDDAALIEGIGHKVMTVMGRYDNLKITTPEDITLAEAILTKRLRCELE